MKRTLTVDDIIPNNDFIAIRKQFQSELIRIKKDRRVSVGSDATFYFENHMTLWWQVQEMIRVENGGDEQLIDELSAYAPLLPQVFNDGSMELVATLMIEIEDLERRFKTLLKLGGIEKHIYLCINDVRINAIPETDIDRTNESGKTSAVHFIRFKLTAHDAQAFRSANATIAIVLTHPEYTHNTHLTASQIKALSLDLI